MDFQTASAQIDTQLAFTKFHITLTSDTLSRLAQSYENLIRTKPLIEALTRQSMLFCPLPFAITGYLSLFLVTFSQNVAQLFRLFGFCCQIPINQWGFTLNQCHSPTQLMCI